MNKTLRFIARGSIVLMAASVIVAAAFALLGPPSAAREYHVATEISRFTPTVGHGLIQFGGEAMLLALVAYVGRRWLRVRL